MIIVLVHCVGLMDATFLYVHDLLRPSHFDVVFHHVLPLSTYALSTYDCFP